MKVIINRIYYSIIIIVLTLFQSGQIFGSEQSQEKE